jgi:hypothetical protein
MSVTTELLFLGLPETGKTTYFIALDELLQTEQHGLVSNGFAANRAYLEKAKVMWRAGEIISRTNLAPVNEPVELLVRHAESGAVAHLVAPDVFGEFYDDQWADRKWPVSYRERLESLAGILLFINAAKSGRNSEMTALWQNLPQATPSVKPWEPRAAAQQLKLVDLLQIVAERGRIKKPLPLAIMISAWDLIESADKLTTRPDDFLQKEWSLLHQYLLANPELFRSRIYGVSARGGDNAAQANLVLLSPHERVWLKDGIECTKDLTRPVRWLLGWE